MAILKVRNKAAPKTADTTLLGITIVNRVHSYLALYALARGVTRANIVRQELERWHNEMLTLDSDHNLIQEIIHKIQLHWSKRSELHPGISREEFLREVKNDLQRKGISEDHIQIILSKKLNGT
jgi:hypothetical protein